METISALLGFVILFVVMVLYFRAKDNYSGKHPKQCSFCGKEHKDPFKLKDGYICWDCCRVRCGGHQVVLRDYLDGIKGRTITVAEVRNYMDKLKEIGKEPFQATRVSESGRIAVDDNQGLFLIQNVPTAQFPHRIADIRSFRVKMEEDSTTKFDPDVIAVGGGYIEIKLNELIDTVKIETGVQEKFIGMRHEVKKTYKDDIEFLEEISGRH